MPFYESVFIARQDIAAPQVEALTDTFKKIIEDDGGSIPKQEYWGLRSLAYKIKKNRKGHYVLLNIDGPATAITEMERQMRINEDVLRYLTIRVDELEEEPSAIMRSRGSDDRPRRGPPREGHRDSAPGEVTPTADKPAEKPADKPAEKPAEASEAPTETVGGEE